MKIQSIIKLENATAKAEIDQHIFINATCISLERPKEEIIAMLDDLKEIIKYVEDHVNHN